MRAAGVDIGTNSVRLLVAEVGRGEDGPRLETRQRLMAITRLGEGVDERGVLNGDAMRRTADVLREYREIMRREEVRSWEVAATSAAREAANADEFMEIVREIMGKEPRVLSGEEEARLSFKGATYDLGDLRPREGAILVVDIGGGSTEIIVGRDGEILETVTEPDVPFMEAIGGTGDTITGMTAAFVYAGLEPPEAAVIAARANRMAGKMAAVTPATKVGRVIAKLPEVFQKYLCEWSGVCRS